MAIIQSGEPAPDENLGDEDDDQRALDRPHPFIRWLFCSELRVKGDEIGKLAPIKIRSSAAQDHIHQENVVRELLMYLGPSRDLARVASVCRMWSDIAKVIMEKGSVVVVAEGSDRGTIRVYDFSQQRWGFLRPYPCTQWLLVLNNHLIAIGLGTCAEYDPQERRWCPLESCSALDRFLIGCVMDEGRLIVVCGYELGQTVIMEYDGRWKELSRFPLHVCLASVGVIMSGKEKILVLVGGDDDGRLIDLTLALNPSSGTWRTLPKVPHGPMFPGGFVVWNNQLVIAGGWKHTLRDATTHHCSAFDLETMEWSSLPPILFGSVSGLTLVDGKPMALVDDGDEDDGIPQGRLVMLAQNRWEEAGMIPRRPNEAGSSFKGRLQSVLGTTRAVVGNFFDSMEQASAV